MLGVLDVLEDTSGILSQQDVELLELVSSQLAITLQNAQHYQETQAHIALQATISMITDRIRSTTTVEDAIKVALEELTKQTGGSQATTKLQVMDWQEDTRLASN